MFREEVWANKIFSDPHFGALEKVCGLGSSGLLDACWYISIP